MSSGAGEHLRLETAKHDLFSLLDKMTSIKGFNNHTLDIVQRFTEQTMALLNKAYAGNMTALAQAEKYIRDMDAAYHATPAVMKQLVPAKAMLQEIATPSFRSCFHLLESMPDGGNIETKIFTGVLVGVIVYLISHFLIH